MCKFEDLTGRRFGRLLVESRAENSQSGKARWNCLCDCNERIVALAANLKNGNTQSCGCYQRQRSSESKIKDIIGMRFGMLTILERIGKEKVRCLCDCGKEVIIKYSNLISGNTKSCGHLKSVLTSERMSMDMIGKTFGELTVIKRISLPGETLNPLWLCICSCGRYTIVNGNKLRSGHTKSCGHLRHSVPESIIVHYLNAAKIKYKAEFMFQNLISEKGYPLRFDFRIDTAESYFLLEYQGEQHFRECDDDFGRQQREITDAAKKEYCKNNNIELVEIRYDENIIESLEIILKEHNLLQDNPVPSSE